MNAKQKLAGMKACIADYKSDLRTYLEEPDGTWEHWSALSLEGKLVYLARDATLYDLTPDQFVQVIREEFKDLHSAVRETAMLRLVLHSAKETRELEKQLPDDGLLAPPPLAERLRDLLDTRSDPRSRGVESGKDRDIEM